MARERGEGFEMLVADDGVGLPETVDPQGSGSLGLDLVFTLAEQLDAQVRVERNAGTTFRFEISAPEVNGGQR